MPESRPKRRWYHLSPDRLIGGLLAVEGFLLLSEWFQWFAFNEKKGWTVLIAVAAVCLVLVVMLPWLGATLLFRWRFQFSLRSLVVLVVAVAVPCCWIEWEQKPVQAIRKAGGSVTYDYQYLDDSGHVIAVPARTWVRRLGDELLSDVADVNLCGCEDVDDGLLEHIKALKGLSRLDLGGTQVTDVGLEHLKELTELRSLNLAFTQITNDGLQHLKMLADLETLYLGGTAVTDAGLEHLKVLTNLDTLFLGETQITDRGLEHLKELRQLKNLMLDKTQITDTGIQHLKGLQNLETLMLSDTLVTKKGIKELHDALPNCNISWTPPTSKTNRDQN